MPTRPTFFLPPGKVRITEIEGDSKTILNEKQCRTDKSLWMKSVITVSQKSCMKLIDPLMINFSSDLSSVFKLYKI